MIRHQFNPKWYHVFSEPFYIIRRRLVQSLERWAAGFSGSLLDFGCGSKPYRALFNVDEYIGLDIHTEVSESNPDLKADIFYDGKVIPFDAGRFDGIFSTEVLEHVFNPDEILPEWNRVLRMGGTVLLTCPFFWPEHEQPYDYARYTSFGLTHLLKKHGFEVEAYDKTGSYFDVLIQSFVLYLYFLIPKRLGVLAAALYAVFVTPFLLLGLLFSSLLPKGVKRSDLYLNNVVLARKVR